MQLRPRPAWPQPTSRVIGDVDAWLRSEFRFAHAPILFDPRSEAASVSATIDSGDDTDDEEERIESSWHHRAMLGDENRIPYVECDDDELSVDEEGPSEVDDSIVVF